MYNKYEGEMMDIKKTITKQAIKKIRKTEAGKKSIRTLTITGMLAGGGLLTLLLANHGKEMIEREEV